GRTRTVKGVLLAVVRAGHGAVRQALAARILSQALRLGRQIEHHPMHPDALRRLWVGCVGVIDDEREALGAGGYTLDRKRRRAIVALAGKARGNLAARLEGGRCQRQSHGHARIGREQNCEGECDKNGPQQARRAPTSHHLILARAASRSAPREAAILQSVCGGRAPRRSRSISASMRREASRLLKPWWNTAGSLTSSASILR